jgi:PAS domain S-box-containing protein
MSPLFWVDIVFLCFAAVIATALTMIALGAGIRSGLNLSFAIFTLIEAAWAMASVGLRLALWLNVGNPVWLGELTALTFSLMGPALFVFTTYYVKRQSRKTNLAAIVGVIAIAILAIPLFQHKLVSNPQLDINGSTTLELSRYGLLTAVIPLLYFVGSLALFFQARHRLGEPYLVLSILILVFGFVFGGVANIALPIVSITNTVSIMLLGYSVISLQLFNPLKERTLELQREINERVRAEDALRKSEERFRILSEQARDAIYLHDNAGNMLDTNIETCQALGYTREELLNLTVTDIDASYDLRTSQDIWNSLESGTSIIIETVHRRKDGTTFPVEVNITKFPLDDQPVFLASARDITMRKQSDTQLRKLWRAIEQSHNTVVITDTQGRIEYSNPKFTQLTGYLPEEVLGKKSNVLNSGQHPPEFYRELWQVIKSGEVWQGEFHNKKKNGELYWEFAAISPVRDPDGHITHYVKVAEDITNRKKTEQALLQASRLETAATLAGGIAHKVNNLMTAVLGYAELLKLQLADNAGAMDILTTIATSAKQTSELAQQMLAFARGGKYQPRPLNLNTIIQDVLQLQQRNLPARIIIEQNAEVNLWNVEADPSQLSQVILNLLTNAVEAIEGQGKITITTQNITVDNGPESATTALEPGLYVEIIMQDTGCGMEPDTLARIFEPFFTTKFQGRGMGLAAVYGIVNNHGGKITVTSQVNQGTTFQVYLPAISTQAPQLFEGQPATAMFPRPGLQTQQTILIAEDDPIILEIMQKMLISLGHRPLAARNGQEATEIAHTFNGEINLALLNLELPVINGTEIFSSLMKARPAMKVIIYSSHELDETAQTILDAGASAFLRKPFQLDTLKKEIYQALYS